MSTRIQNGDTERVRVTALDSVGVPITGLADVLVEIARDSDDFYLDFNDNTFKASGWTTRQQAMTELDAVNSPGAYYYDFDTTGFSDDNYFIRVTSATATNDPFEGELKVGGYVDYIIDPALINDISPAEVNAEMVNVLTVDTFAEPGQEAPAATNTLAVKIGYLFKLMRNKLETTSAETRVYDDAGTTVDHKASVSDDGTTFTRDKFGAGP